MKGKVFKVNRNRKMVAIQTENGDFSVYEQQGEDKIRVGDDVEWKGDAIIGDVVLRNHTQHYANVICFKFHRVALNVLNARLLFKV